MKMWVAGSFVAAVLTGCGTDKPACTPQPPTLAVTPQSAKADHDASAPGNQVHFYATSSATPSPGCATPQVIQLLTPQWSSSDPHNVSISSTADTNNGLALCLGATAGPVTLTAHIPSGTTTVLLNASLFCE